MRDQKNRYEGTAGQAAVQLNFNAEMGLANRPKREVRSKNKEAQFIKKSASDGCYEDELRHTFIMHKNDLMALKKLAVVRNIGKHKYDPSWVSLKEIVAEMMDLYIRAEGHLVDEYERAHGPILIKL